MATKPVGCQDQDPVISLDEQVNESWVLGEVGAAVRRSLLPGINAPRAEPEEDVDIMEPGAKDQTLQENQILTSAETGDTNKLGNQKETKETFKVMMENAPRKLSETSQDQEETENPVDVCEDAFPPPPPPLTDLSSEARFEKEGFHGAGCLSVSEMTSDLAEDLMTPNKDLISEEMAEDHMTAGERDTWLRLSSDGFDTTKPENNALVSGHHHSSDSNNSDDAYPVCSPPFADDSEEEEEVWSDVTFCLQQWGLDSRCKPLQPLCSASAVVPTEQNALLLAVPLAKQQDELLPQNHSGLVPKRENQEAAQQVHGQGSAPLSTVSMELSNQGGAASQGSGCIEAVGERHSRAGGRTQGESEQTGGEKGQRDIGLGRSEAVGRHGRGLLRHSRTVPVQEPEPETHSCGVYCNHQTQDRMESDSCDDSQSDSGVSTDFSPYSTLEDNTTISTGTPATTPKETPIEREIRRAVAREQSLRRSRGLPDASTPTEYVEIPLRKTVLLQSLTTKSERCHGKDRQFADKKMEHEIHEEVQREQDLIKLGKVPGFYDKGTVRQLRERKELFEAFQKPSDFTLATSRSSPRNVSTSGNPEDVSPQSVYLERRSSADLLSPTRYHVRREAEPVTAVDSGSPSTSSSSATGRHGGINSRTQEKEEEEEVAAKNNPFFKLRSSTNIIKVEQDIREAQERERELCKQRISLYGETGGAMGGRYGGGGGGGVKSASTEARHSAVSSSSVNGLTAPDSSPRWGSGPSAAHESPGRVNIWPPAQAEDSRTTQQEVLHTPRTPRQRNPLVQRWEAGLVNGQYKEED